MTLSDFLQHVPAIEDGIRLIKAGIYITLAKRFMSSHSEDDAAKLAFCVTSGLFLMPLEQEKYSTFADAHSDLVQNECMKVASDPDLAEAASYVYAVLIMLTAWQTCDMEVGMSLTERATDLGFIVPNIVQMWGSRTIVAFHEFAEDFARRRNDLDTAPLRFR